MESKNPPAQSSPSSAKTIEALYLEERRFDPPPEFRARAVVGDESLYAKAAQDPEAFWAEQAESLDWFRKWDKVRKWEPPWVQWFIGGKLNVSYNCVDRHVNSPRRNKAALVWEGEPGEERVLTYNDLYREVNKFANVLKRLGLKKGDRVAIYMPMILELPIAMLACTRLGCPHTIVFGGFSPESLRDRINDAAATVVITADGGYRRGSILPLKQNVDEALQGCPGVKNVVPGDRTLVNPTLSCGTCAACAAGDDNRCRFYDVIGRKRNGGYAEWVTVPAANCLPYPGNLTWEQAAAVPLVFVTAWHMLVTRARVRPGEDVLVIGAGSGVGSAAIQINSMVSTNFASRLTDDAGNVLNGPVSWLSYAFRFLQLPLGVFGVALASATLPRIARSAAVSRMTEFRSTLAGSIGTALLCSIPSSIGLAILGESMIALIYEGGQFRSAAQ